MKLIQTTPPAMITIYMSMCLAGTVANVADSDRCRCNPKVPSSIPAGGKDFPSARKFNHIALCRGGAHKSTGPLCVYSD